MVPSKCSCTAAVLSPALFPAAAVLRPCFTRSRRVYLYITLLLLLLHTFYYSKKNVFHLFLFYSHVVDSEAASGVVGGGWRIIFVSPITHVIAFRPYLYNPTHDPTIAPAVRLAAFYNILWTDTHSYILRFSTVRRRPRKSFVILATARAYIIMHRA